MAALVSGLELKDSLQLNLGEMARRTFDWIVRRLLVRQPLWHARLITIKNAAYAWRQMLFYLSFVGADELAEFIAWAEETVAFQPPEFQSRFRPILEGLIAASRGVSPAGPATTGNRPKQFLGWTHTRHYLLD